jgi:hypothetical protein
MLCDCGERLIEIDRYGQRHVVAVARTKVGKLKSIVAISAGPGEPEHKLHPGRRLVHLPQDKIV